MTRCIAIIMTKLPMTNKDMIIVMTKPLTQ